MLISKINTITVLVAIGFWFTEFEVSFAASIPS